MRPVLSHDWGVSPQEAYRIQEELSTQVVVENGFDRLTSVGGIDAAFEGDEAYVALVVYSYPGLEKLEEVVAEEKVRSPYIPGLLSFREGPLLLRTLQKAKRRLDLILFDGQGIAHPRRLGLASHMGVLLDKPTIGCAKSRLLGEHGHLAPKKGSVAPLMAPGEMVGWAVRTRHGVKPVYVSPGHLVDLETSLSVVLSCTQTHRLPEPLREADLLSRKRRRVRRAVGRELTAP